MNSMQSVVFIQIVFIRVYKFLPDSAVGHALLPRNTGPVPPPRLWSTGYVFCPPRPAWKEH